MQYSISKEVLATLEASVQAEYTVDGDTATLNIEGDNAPTFAKIASLEKKRSIEAEHRKAAESKVKESDDRAAKLQKDLENAGDDGGELAKVKEAHAAELEGMRLERATQDAAMKTARNSAMILEEANGFASGNFVDTPYGAKFIASEVAKRLSVEEINGSPVVRVVNPDGTPSTAALGDLHKEFLDNKDFSPIIKAKAGSGGGAIPSSSGGATTKKISEMTATEEAAFERESPDAYAAAIR